MLHGLYVRFAIPPRGWKRRVQRKVSMSVKPHGAGLLQTQLRNLMTHSSRGSRSAFEEDDQHACPGGIELTYTLGRTERAVRCRQPPWWMDDQKFGKWNGIMISLMISVVTFVAIFITCGCCAVPCIRALSNQNPINLYLYSIQYNQKIF